MFIHKMLDLVVPCVFIGHLLLTKFDGSFRLSFIPSFTYKIKKNQLLKE